MKWGSTWGWPRGLTTKPVSALPVTERLWSYFQEPYAHIPIRRLQTPCPPCSHGQHWPHRCFSKGAMMALTEKLKPWILTDEAQKQHWEIWLLSQLCYLQDGPGQALWPFQSPWSPETLSAMVQLKWDNASGSALKTEAWHKLGGAIINLESNQRI